MYFFFSQNSTPLALSLKTIEEEKRKNTTLAILKANILSNSSPKLSATGKYYLISHSISVIDNILLFKYKINIFASLQETTLVLTHVGQKAVARTKQRLYFKFWWTGMNQSINYSVRKCYSWQVVTPVSKKTPLQMTLIPNDA